MHLAYVEGSIDERIQHRVGHSNKEKTQKYSWVDFPQVKVGKANKYDVIRSPTDNKGQYDNKRDT